MQMSEILDKLKNLQDVLAEKYEIEAKVQDLPKTLTGSTENLESLKKEFIEKNAEHEAEKAKVAALRLELDDAARMREAGEKGMDEISTHREYEVLDKQIAEAQEKETSIRKSLQKEEKTLSQMDDSLKGLEELISSTEQDVTDAKQNLERELAEYNTHLEDLRKQEIEKAEGVDPEIIFKFQRIIQRNRKGIVAVRGKVCDGCHMILPSQFANEVHKGEKILFCPYCSRILYYEEAEESDSSYYTMGEAGSLADLDDDEDSEFDEFGEEGNLEDEAVEDDVKSSMEYED